MQEIDELLGQNLTQQDEDAIAEELESILVVRQTLYTNTVCIITYQLAAHQRHKLVALSASPSNRFSATPYTYVLTRLCLSSSGNIGNGTTNKIYRANLLEVERSRLSGGSHLPL